MVLDHVWFGTILGDNGKPIKTREGEPIKLSELLDEAEQRALTVVQAKNPSLPAAEQISVARVVGIGAVKYADLMQNRTVLVIAHRLSTIKNADKFDNKNS